MRNLLGYLFDLIMYESRRYVKNCFAFLSLKF